MTPEMLHVQFAGRFKEALAEAHEIYREHGCFLARSLFDPAEFAGTQENVRALVDAIFHQLGRTRSPEADGRSRFDDGVCELARIDRRLVGQLFDAGRRLLPVHQLSVDPRLISISKALMATDVISASDIKALRIDLPNEEKYLFDWHQDYPYVMDSLDAVVFWIPLQDVDESNGWLTVAAGSHKAGMQKLRLIDPDNAANNKQKMMQIAAADAHRDYPNLSLPVKLGDVLVFSTLLLHASGHNRSTRPRFTMQIRFGNYLHPVAVAKGWPGSMRDGSVFHERHPEYIASS
jgi:hypothetical protein